MDKEELKQILHEQFEPLAAAVEKKLAYLQSDNVFSDEIYGAEENAADMVGDNSLMNAFGAVQNTSPVPYQASLATDAPMSAEHAEIQRNKENIDERRQNIAARIASLRGISMPGDYILRK